MQINAQNEVVLETRTKRFISEETTLIENVQFVRIVEERVRYGKGMIYQKTVIFVLADGTTKSIYFLHKWRENIETAKFVEELTRFVEKHKSNGSNVPLAHLPLASPSLYQSAPSGSTAHYMQLPVGGQQQQQQRGPNSGCEMVSVVVEPSPQTITVAIPMNAVPGSLLRFTAPNGTTVSQFLICQSQILINRYMHLLCDRCK